MTMPKRRKTTKTTRVDLYAASRYLPSSVEQELGVQIPFDMYLQDPMVAQNDPKFGFDDNCYMRWEPGLADGPTSARFAVVDYNGDTGHIAPMARWDGENECFLDPDGQVLNQENVEPLQFHQVNVWAVLQRALAFFEGAHGLGRPIPFGFDGNRLIVVPHAGYGQNAFYDRASKSLQFYYFDNDDKTVYTCLSTDIINHEFGHAVLDGVRPYFFESGLIQTGAFHEFVGDMTAILIILRNNKFRNAIAETTGADLAEAKYLKHIAEQFGRAVEGKPYLRTATNDQTMSKVANEIGPHLVSEVLTGTMFEILTKLSRHYIDERGESVKNALWHSVERMQRMAIQPLDLLPPVDITFRDYALAVLRAEQLSNPTDPHGYLGLMLDVFVKRGILDETDRKAFDERGYVYDRLQLKVFHDIGDLSRSRAAAYRFLDDNRNELFIPANQDVIVADLYDAKKFARQARRLPRQIILEYLWPEEVILEGEQFGEYEGERMTMLCGGTLVFDEHGNVLSWFRKSGTQGGSSDRWKEEIAAGEKRREDVLADIARRIRAGYVGAALGSSKGILGSHLPPLTVRRESGVLRFELSPHMSLTGDDHENYKGGRQWEVSS
jgi:hypothetical protein